MKQMSDFTTVEVVVYPKVFLVNDLQSQDRNSWAFICFPA